MNRRFLIGGGISALALLAGGIGLSSIRRPLEQGSTLARNRSYALNVVNSSIPAWLFAVETLKKMEASVPGFRSEFGGPTSGDVSQQLEQLDVLIRRRVNGIILCPADTKSLIPTINRAAAEGIPIVTIFGDVTGSAQLTTVAADEEASAYNLAKRVIRDQKWDESAGTGPIPVMVMITKPGLPFAEQRLQGIKRALSEHKSMQLVRVAANEWSDRRGAELVNAAIQEHPNLKAVFGTDSRSAVGTATALRELNKSKGAVVVTGWDNDDDTLALVQDGWVQYVSAPNMAYMIQTAVAALEAASLGYLYPPALKLKELGVPAAPAKIDIGQSLIDRTNVAAFRRSK